MTRNHGEKVEIFIIHDYTENQDECMPGEEVIAIVLVYRGKRYWVPLGPTHMILFDFLCRNRFCAHDAIWIASHMQLDPLVIYHGTNAPGHVGRPARTNRTAVRQQIKRIREALALLFEEEGLDLDAWDIVRSEESSTRVVRYRINADVSWVHWPPPEEGDPSGVPHVPRVPPGLLPSAAGLPYEIRVP